MTAPAPERPAPPGRPAAPVRSYPEAVGRLAGSSALGAARAYEALVLGTLAGLTPDLQAVFVAALVAHLLRGNRRARMLAAQAVRLDVIVHTRRSAPALVTGPPVEAERARLTQAVTTLVERAVEAAAADPGPTPAPAPDRPSPGYTGPTEAELAARYAAEDAAEAAADAARDRARLAQRALERRAGRAARDADRRVATRARRRAVRVARRAEERERRETQAAYREADREAAAEARRDAAVLARANAREAAQERDQDRRDAEADSRQERRAAARAADAARREAEAEVAFRREVELRRVERLAAAETYRAAQNALLESAELQNQRIDNLELDDDDEIIEGWVRQLNGENCPRCEAWADGKVRPLGTRMKWHVSCNCSARLVWTKEYDNGGFGDLTGLDEPIARRDSYLSTPRNQRRQRAG